MNVELIGQVVGNSGIHPVFRRRNGLGGGVTSWLLASLIWTWTGPPAPRIAADDGPYWEELDDDGDGWSNGDEAYTYFTDPWDSSSYPGSDPGGGSGMGDPNGGEANEDG